MERNDMSFMLAPGKIGDLTLPNRFVMSSVSRKRTDHGGVPSSLQAEYYAQRASAGLVMTECAAISNNARVFNGACGIYTQEQVEGWKKVTQSVHAKQGKIFVQIWHGGRATHPAIVGELNLAPSPIAIKGSKNSAGMDFVVPKEMTKDDIELLKEQHRSAALNAKEAGFDGIELHGATGYIIDQFLRDGTNKRTDEYGGSVENRCRLALEVMDILIEVFGAQRVGIKLSPVSRYLDMYDSDPLATFQFLLKELGKRGVAYAQICEPSEGDDQMTEVCKTFRPFFNGTIIANNLFTPETGAQIIKRGYADFVSFGRLYIANPDLVERARNSWPYAQLDFATVLTTDAKGYTDYPTYKNSTVGTNESSIFILGI